MAFGIVIAPALFDIAEPLILAHPAESEVDGVTRRVSRTPTLDGGAVLTDLGATDADRTLRLAEAGASREQVDAARRLALVHPRVTVATAEGVWLGALEAVGVRNGQLTMTFLPTARLSAAQE